MEASGNRVSGLDSIRFLCAIIVMLGHFGLSDHRISGASQQGIHALAVVVMNCLFNGPAAVIVFFVISGFCIHFPFRGTKKLSVSQFYARRSIRLVLPALVSFLFLRYVLGSVTSPQDTVLWSIICEGIYYLIYPALLYLRRKTNWPMLIAISLICAFALMATHLNALRLANNEYVALRSATWIIGLPCWLLGCWLAEIYQSFPLVSPIAMWSMRAAVFASSVALRIAMFHVHSPLASNCFTLDIFAFAICAWLGFEIVYTSEHKAFEATESLGKWSYSLYLVHPLVPASISAIGLLALLSGPFYHLLLIAITLSASFGFYLLIEKPSHLLAVSVGRSLSTTVLPAVPVSK